MDLNDLFITMILVNSLWVLVLRPTRSWVIKAVGVLLLLGGFWYWHPDRAGWWTIGPWVVLIAVPFFLEHWTHLLIQKRQLAWARWMSGLLLILHPTRSVWRMRQVIRSLQKMYQGAVSTGLQLAQQAGLDDTHLRNLGMVIHAQISGEWDEFEQLIQATPLRNRNDAVLLGGRLQSASERRDWDELDRIVQVIGKAHFSPEQSVALSLKTFAILGDVATVHHLLQSNQSIIASDSQAYWTAIAEQVSGAIDLAKLRLQRLLPHSSPILRPMIVRRLDQPAVGPVDEVFRKRCQTQLGSIRSVIEHDVRYAVLSGGRPHWPIMTLSLILILIAVFWKEIPGGSEDTDNLLNMGAMAVPLTGEPGEWKRVITSGFLHVGPIHLTLNLLGLLLLGQFIERAWGPLLMLVLFLICLVISAALLPVLIDLPPEQTAVFAGASGGIMGLLGGIWGHLFVGWSQQATPMVRRQFRTVCSFIILQSLCDLLTPQVSMTCHLIGLFTGFIGGILMGLTRGRRGVDRAV